MQSKKTVTWEGCYFLGKPCVKFKMEIYPSYQTAVYKSFYSDHMV